MKPAICVQNGPVFSLPAEVKGRGVRLAAAGIVVGEEDAAEGEFSSGLQVSDGGQRSDGEEGQVDVSEGDVPVVQADVGAGVVDPEVTEAQGAVGRDGHAAGLVRVLAHLPPADLHGVPRPFEEGPGDEGAVWGHQGGAGQDGVASEPAVHKHCRLFTVSTWKEAQQKKICDPLTLVPSHSCIF